MTGTSLVRASWLLGGDAGGAYLALDHGETAEIVVVPSRGAPAERACIPEFRPPTDMSSESAPYSAIPGRVSAGGKLYLLASAEDRVTVQCLSMRSIPRWRWWGQGGEPEVCLCS
ncbi:MAG: hypothetical protein A2Y96_01375 [Firmicutes bacterium RBG_13_65_8]|nr:MAG: hypothetical protein A2Y96_01375 [Firmicutes bacterium RBG_13_65_8]